MEALIPIGLFLLLVLLAWLFGLAGDSDAGRIGEVLTRVRYRDANNPDAVAILRDAKRNRFLDLLLTRINLFQRLEEYMWQAGLYLRPSEVLLIVALLFGAGTAAGVAWLGDAMFGAGLGLALSIAPLLYIRFRRNHRLKMFAQQLPEALDLLKASLEAGHSLMRGLQAVVDEFPDPVAGEIRMVLEQTRIGLPLADALEEMLKRVPEESLRFLLVAVRVQSDVGSSLAHVVGRLSETLRNRQKVQMQIRALTAQSRMSGMVVALLPILVLAAFSVVQPRYAQTLFYDPIGLKMLKAALLLDAMAFITMRRILRMDY